VDARRYGEAFRLSHLPLYRLKLSPVCDEANRQSRRTSRRMSLCLGLGAVSSVVAAAAGSAGLGRGAAGSVVEAAAGSGARLERLNRSDLSPLSLLAERINDNVRDERRNIPARRPCTPRAGAPGDGEPGAFRSLNEPGAWSRCGVPISRELTRLPKLRRSGCGLPREALISSSVTVEFHLTSFIAGPGAGEACTVFWRRLSTSIVRWTKSRSPQFLPTGRAWSTA
jgi:hypothetical protein